MRIEGSARTSHGERAEQTVIDRIAHDARRAAPALVLAAIVLGSVNVQQRLAQIERGANAAGAARGLAPGAAGREPDTVRVGERVVIAVGAQYHSGSIR